MKKIMILASAIMMATAINAQECVVEPFNGVKVVVPSRVRVLLGDSYSVSVNSANEIAKNVLRYTVKDGILTITSPEDIQQNMDSSEMVITITTPRETKVTTSRDMEIVPIRKHVIVRPEHPLLAKQ